LIIHGLPPEAADLANALDARQLGFALLKCAIGIIALARDVFEVLAQPFGGDGLGQGVFQGIGRCDAEAHVPDRYSHRRSVIAIAERTCVAGKCGFAGSAKVRLTNAGPSILFQELERTAGGCVFARRNTSFHEAPLSEEAKS